MRPLRLLHAQQRAAVFYLLLFEVSAPRPDQVFCSGRTNLDCMSAPSASPPAGRMHRNSAATSSAPPHLPSKMCSLWQKQPCCFEHVGPGLQLSVRARISRRPHAPQQRRHQQRAALRLLPRRCRQTLLRRTSRQTGSAALWARGRLQEKAGEVKLCLLQLLALRSPNTGCWKSKPAQPSSG